MGCRLIYLPIEKTNRHPKKKTNQALKLEIFNQTMIVIFSRIPIEKTTKREENIRSIHRLETES